jgi:hypothetical protein
MTLLGREKEKQHAGFEGFRRFYCFCTGTRKSTILSRHGSPKEVHIYIGYVWMVARCSLANFLALTYSVGSCLDESQSSQSAPIFWQHVYFLHQLPGEPAEDETLANIGEPRFGKRQLWALSKQPHTLSVPNLE